MEPAVLLADEPSGNLDAENGETVMDLLFDLVSQNQMTMILVTHNKSLADRCHRQYQLKYVMIMVLVLWTLILIEYYYYY